MSWSENRREYLDKKYEEYDDEADIPRVKGSQRQIPKKAKHKHEYRNCVLTYQEKVPSYRTSSGFEARDYDMLGSYCTICGKVGKFDPKTDSYGYYNMAHRRSYNDPLRMSFDDMYKAYKKVLPSFDIPEWDCKYISM